MTMTVEEATLIRELATDVLRCMTNEEYRATFWPLNEPEEETLAALVESLTFEEGARV